MAGLLQKYIKIVNPTFYGKIVIAPDLSYEVVHLKNGITRYRIKTPYPGKRILGLKVSILRRLITKTIRKNDEVVLTMGKTYIDTIRREDLAKIKI